MLVLTRKAKETLLIGDEVKITVVAIEGERVRLAIDAPREITILRQEIVASIEAENRESVNASFDQKDLSQVKDLLP